MDKMPGHPHLFDFEVFDEIIVGGGPCTVAYLSGLSTDKQRLLIGSPATSRIDGKLKRRFPKKITLNAMQADLETYQGFWIFNGFGGMSHFWGGVLPALKFSQYRELIKGNLSNNDISRSLKSILETLSKFNPIYVFDGDGNYSGLYDESMYAIEGYTYVMSSSEVYGWEGSGLSVCNSLHHHLARLKISIVNAKVDSFSKDGDIFNIKTNIGSFFSRNLILAGGAPSNIKILRQSVNAGSGCIRDHVPMQIAGWFFGNGKKLSGTPIYSVIRDHCFQGNIYNFSNMSSNFYRLF
jgi:hypothetical protein